jgi:hypothetical protein
MSKESILVLQFRGKKNDKSDYVMLLQFNTIDEKKQYIKNNTNIDDKYYTIFESIDSNKEIEIPYI